MQSRKKKKSNLKTKYLKLLFLVIAILVFIFFMPKIKTKMAYYLGFKSHHAIAQNLSNAARDAAILKNHADFSIGIDVSEYQEKISWSYVDSIKKKYPIHFVFIRATVGSDRIDRQFERNWLGAKKNNMIRGAYHYYRPNENSLQQAMLFIKNVSLEEGDLPPVLDIEKLPKNQSIDSLKVGLRRWLEKVEDHYGVRPIIYTGEKYYDDFLKEAFDDYPFWIANYNHYRSEIDDQWLFWQFTESAVAPGIKTRVDVNVFNGDLYDLQSRTIN
jgi:lysozyme